MTHKIQYDCIILFHVTFFVDYCYKYFLFGQKFCGLCMRACTGTLVCMRSVTIINYDFCYQQLFFFPVAGDNLCCESLFHSCEG